MVMKRPPAMISPSGRVPEQGCRSPRLDFRGDGASLYVSWKITPSSNFLGFRAIYRRRGDERRWPGRPGAHQARPRADPHLGVTQLPPGPPPGLLRSLSSFRVKTDLRGFSAHSENISLRGFLKYKNSRKQQLAWGILLIGQCMKTSGKRRKTCENMWKT